MKILVTGAKGFIGRNLIEELKNRKYTDIYEFDIDTDIKLLDQYCFDCDFVFVLHQGHGFLGDDGRIDDGEVFGSRLREGSFLFLNLFRFHGFLFFSHITSRPPRCS